ncbi:MAG TPA: protein-L-isoaspartate O-methyltransferase [Beijerinckiaceae bacterium]|jgi:protein-L-isoaspartate(D-aspartate) O-methyltransferase
MIDFALARRAMVDSQVRTFDVNDLPLLAVLDELPRENFVPAGRENLAYIDRDMCVSDGINGAEKRFMLSPMVLARLIQDLGPRPGERVLDIACGLGYSTAAMARLGAKVTGLESSEAMAAETRTRLAGVGVEAEVAVGDLKAGLPQAAPFDAILVNGTVEERPEALLQQLAEGGRLACVLGTGRVGRATLFTRAGDAFGSRALFDAHATALPAFRREPGFVF